MTSWSLWFNPAWRQFLFFYMNHLCWLVSNPSILSSSLFVISKFEVRSFDHHCLQLRRLQSHRMPTTRNIQLQGGRLAILRVSSRIRQSWDNYVANVISWIRADTFAIHFAGSASLTSVQAVGLAMTFAVLTCVVGAVTRLGQRSWRLIWPICL